MFHTHPEAELTLPPGLAPFGQRSWHWLELPLQIPYFFISINVENEECTFRRHFLFSQLRDALSLIGASRDVFKNLEIGLLSPGYMNGSNSYQLGQVKEIWECRGGYEQMFLMSDGAKFHFPPNEDGKKDQEMELVVSL